jgi:hypothetical protein
MVRAERSKRHHLTILAIGKNVCSANRRDSRQTLDKLFAVPPSSLPATGALTITTSGPGIDDENATVQLCT